MSDTVIKVENLSKHYNLGTIGSGTLYRDVQSWWAKLRGKEDPNTQLGTWNADQVDTDSSFWALKDVSFEVKQGDVLGIIGRNGAGKSTLLKILSRVTGPTSGNIKIKGRVASLLEVGTGFHPELTGRENVYLNGTILGMRKTEIDRKFDEIVAFAEIEKFIDTPVKRYSSGMYVRLAFAVAAHLDPEILIVDEVLAVGDAEFQKKCLGKMGEVSKEGRTVLFVSHNMAAVRSLCNRGLLLRRGELYNDGSVTETIKHYALAHIENNKGYWSFKEHKKSFDNEMMQSICLSLIDSNGVIISSEIDRSTSVYVLLEFCLKKIIQGFTIGVSAFDENGVLIFRSLHTDGLEADWPQLALGENRLLVELPVSLMNSGKYRIVLDGGINNKEWYYNPHTSEIEVVLSINEHLSDSPYWRVKREGCIAPHLKWSLR